MVSSLTIAFCFEFIHLIHKYWPANNHKLTFSVFLEHTSHPTPPPQSYQLYCVWLEYALKSLSRSLFFFFNFFLPRKDTGSSLTSSRSWIRCQLLRSTSKSTPFTRTSSCSQHSLCYSPAARFSHLQHHIITEGNKNFKTHIIMLCVTKRFDSWVMAWMLHRTAQVPLSKSGILQPWVEILGMW